MTKIFTTRVKTNLNGVLQMTQMVNGIMMTGDNAANQIVVELYNDFDKVIISNDTRIVGYFIRSDGNTIEVDGSVNEEGEAVVIIPETAYQVSGSMSIAVRLFEDPEEMTYKGYYKIVIRRGYFDSETSQFVEVTDETQTEGPHGEAVEDHIFTSTEFVQVTDLGQETGPNGEPIVIATLTCYVRITESDSLIDEYHHIPDVQELLSYLERLDGWRQQVILEEAGRVEAEEARVEAETARQTNYDTKMSEFDAAEAQRQSYYDTKMSEFDAAEAQRQQTFESNEQTRQGEYEDFIDDIEEEENKRVTAELQRVGNESTRQTNEGTRQENEANREQAQSVRNALIDGLDAEVTQLAPYAEPQVVTTVVGDHKHLHFKLPPGDPFVIAKTFETISLMESYNGEDLRAGQFVLIASNTEDPDNAKMYVVTSAKPAQQTNTFVYVTDLSGAQGIKGDTGNGIASISVRSDYTLRIVYTDGTVQTSGSIRGATGPTGNGITDANVDENYKLNLTFSDGTVYQSESIRGETGAVGPIGPTGPIGLTGNGISDANVDENYKLNITFTDGRAPYQSESIRGPKGEKGDKGDKGDRGVDGIGSTYVEYNQNTAKLFVLFN